VFLETAECKPRGTKVLGQTGREQHGLLLYLFQIQPVQYVSVKLHQFISLLWQFSADSAEPLVR